jgi:hypothetical protein
MKNFKMLSRAEMRNVAGGNMCQPNEYSCGDGTCIDVVMYMDGIIDCPDGSDEEIGCYSSSHSCKASENSALTGKCAPEKSCKCSITTEGYFGQYRTTSDCTF